MNNKFSHVKLKAILLFLTLVEDMMIIVNKVDRYYILDKKHY